MRTGLGGGYSDFVPGESNEELYSLTVSWYSLLVRIHGLLVSLPYEVMGTLIRCFLETRGLLLLYHPSLSPPLVLMVLSSCEHPIFSSDIS